MERKMKLSVLIVNYNGTRVLRNCLLSLEKYITEVTYEVIVIDNLSPDQSWKSLISQFPRVQFIAAEENGGFAKANNRIARLANGEFILLLNPDTELEDQSMADLITFAKSQDHFGCLGVRLHDLNGNFLPESKRIVPDPLSSFKKLFLIGKQKRTSYYRTDIGEYDVAPVEVITGAFLLTRKEVYLAIGGLDEQYFMYGEDIDLCYTLLQAGYTNWYYGKTSVLHIKGECTVKDDVYLERFYGAMQIFVNKYYRSNRILHTVLSLGLKSRHFLARWQQKKNAR